MVFKTRTVEALRERTFVFFFFDPVAFAFFLARVSVELTSGSSRLRMTLDMDEQREPRLERCEIKTHTQYNTCTCRKHVHCTH